MLKGLFAFAELLAAVLRLVAEARASAAGGRAADIRH